MRQSISSRGILALALFGLLSTSAYGARVGYYEMCDGAGASWAVSPISVAGHTPVHLTDLTSADLRDLDVLFVTNCYNIGYSAEYISRLSDIESAVQSGMVLMIHDRLVWRVWEGRLWQAREILPGGSAVISVFNRNSDINILDATTQLTNGPGGVIDNTTLDGGQYSNHGYVQVESLPQGAETILSQANPTEAVTFSYPYGKGSVIYSSIPIDRYGSLSPICNRFQSSDPTWRVCINTVKIYIPNAVAYAVELKNAKPRAVAGPDLSVDEGASITLDGSASRGHGTLSYQWQQLSPLSPVLQFDATSATPGFTAPAVDANTTFTLQLVVTDDRGYVSAPDTVDIAVKDVNTPPVADAGDDFTIKAGADAALDGSHSYDADGDTVTYIWNQIGGPAVSLLNPDTVKPGFVVPNAIGQQLVFELTVNDGKALSPVSTVTVGIVDNAAPLASAGPEQTRDEGQIVSLTALGSSDPDGDGLLFDWSQIMGPAVELDDPGSPTPFFTAPRVAMGGSTLSFAVTVTDTDALNPKSSVAQVTIHLLNINDPPACHLARPSVASLWPPNHKMRPVAIEGVSDIDSLYNKVAIVIDSVTMDEPVTGRGSGHSSPDALILDMDPNDQVLLRAERKKHSNGRVYQVNFTASDGFESCIGNIQVTVPKSRKHDKECDDDEDDRHEEHRGRKDGKADHHKDHKSDGRKAKHCPAPAPVDDGQNYDATEAQPGHHHSIKEKLEKKLAKLKAKWEKYKKKHDKKNKNKDDD